MARIKINDLGNNVNLTEEDVKRIKGGLLLPAVQSAELTHKVSPQQIGLLLPAVQKVR